MVVPHVIAVVPPGRKYRTEAVVPLPQAAVKKITAALGAEVPRAPLAVVPWQAAVVPWAQKKFQAKITPKHGTFKRETTIRN